MGYFAGAAGDDVVRDRGAAVAAFLQDGIPFIYCTVRVMVRGCVTLPAESVAVTVTVPVTGADEPPPPFPPVLPPGGGNAAGPVEGERDVGRHGRGPNADRIHAVIPEDLQNVLGLAGVLPPGKAGGGSLFFLLSREAHCRCRGRKLYAGAIAGSALGWSTRWTD